MFKTQKDGIKSFIKSNTNKGFTLQAKDNLFKVLSYDLDKGRIKAKRMSDGTDVFIKVSTESMMRFKDAEKKYPNAKFFGHLIDERMMKNINVGDLFIGERSIYVNKSEGLSVLDVNKIITPPSQDDNKNMIALMTVQSYENRVRSVQIWENKSYKLNKETYKKIGTMLDEIIVSKEKGEKPCTIGFQFRIIKGNEVCEQSETFDFIPSVKEGDEVIKKAELHTSKTFKELADEFKNYSQDLGEAEVMIYRNYIASSFSKELEIREKSMLHRMANSKVRLSLDDVDSFIVGKNYAVSGIVCFTSDEYDKKAKKEIQRNIVSKVFVNGPAGNINSWVRTSEDKKVVFINELKIFDEKALTSYDTNNSKDELRSKKVEESFDFLEEEFSPEDYADNEDLFEKYEESPFK